MANRKRTLEVSKTKKGPKKQPLQASEPSKPSARPSVSRGRQRYQLVSDIKKEQESYESQVADEAAKAEKRSMWSTIGGVLGAAAGIAAAPVVLGAIGVGALTGAAASVATGVGTGLITGAGSATGGRWGKEGAEKGALGTEKAKRKDIKVDKFFNKKAQEATDTFKDYDKGIDKSIRNQAYVSGAMAGLQASGAFKAAGKAVKKGLGMGESLTTTPVDMSYATDAVAEVPLNPVDEKILSQSTAKPMAVSTIPDRTFAFGPTSDKNLYQLVKEQAMGQAVNYGANSLFSDNKQNKNQNQQLGVIQVPNYS